MGKLPAAPDVYEWLRSRDLAKGRRKEIPPIVVVLSPFLFPCRRADGFMNSPLLCFSVSAFNDKKPRVFLLFSFFYKDFPHTTSATEIQQTVRAASGSYETNKYSAVHSVRFADRLIPQAAAL